MTDPREARWREEFPITQRSIYLNSCSLAPLHERGRRALETFATEWSQQGGPAWYGPWIGAYEALRDDVARVLGADRDEVALEPSVSAALVSVASSFSYGDRPKVVIADMDFPTDGHTWLALERQGIEVEFVRSPDRVTVPLELFERAVDGRTALVCTGHVYYTSGWIQDVKALADVCHAKGAALVVDAYQSIGAFPFDVHDSGVDFLAGGMLKWLMGGPGMAFLYVRKDRIAAHRPTALGWWAMEDPFTFDVEHVDLASSARRFEYGTPSVAAVVASRAGMSLVEEVGIPTVRARHMALSQRLLDGALEQGWRARSPRRAEERTSIVTLEHPEPRLAVQALRSSGVVCDARPGLIRLSPHYFNTAEEIDRALEALLPLRELPAVRVLS